MIIINQNKKMAIIDYSMINIQEHYKDNSNEIMYCVITVKLSNGDTIVVGRYTTLFKAQKVLNIILQSIDDCERFFLMPGDDEVDENI